MTETMFLCGRQNIAIRVNKDDAKYVEQSGINTRNVEALLQFCVNDRDICLGDHLENNPRNVTHISVIRDLIQINIIRDCDTADGFFSISAEKVRNINNHEQIAVKFRFMDKENQIIEEFIVANDGTIGEILLKELLSFVCKVDIDPPLKKS